MDAIEIKSWDEFGSYVKGLEEFRSEQCRKYENNAISNWVYRGQANSAWPLSTTLDRAGWSRREVLDYYRLIYRAKPHIESLSGNSWIVPDLQEVRDRTIQDGMGLSPRLPAYEYLAYLRHHGFPSPLLDWSISPYIALLFAFMDASPSDFVSVYALMEFSTGMKMRESGAARIEQYGPYVRTHRRHSMQQSVYTLCFGGHGEELYFDDYASATTAEDRDQDLLKKVVISSDLRIEFLKQLDRFNLNPYTLFGSEESLLRSIAFREMF